MEDIARERCEKLKKNNDTDGEAFQVVAMARLRKRSETLDGAANDPSTSSAPLPFPPNAEGQSSARGGGIRITSSRTANRVLK